MNEKSPKGRKSGSPKVRKKSEVGMPKSEVAKEVNGERIKAKDLPANGETTSAPDSYWDDTPHSPIKEELPTANQNPDSYREQTKKMEVHHHPQLEHKPKPWKEYILEGLMIFLAVTMGFFAESLREHITDKERETQYVRSMMEDLKDDRSKLEIHIKSLKQNRDMLDSLISILNDDANLSRHGNEVYYFGRLAPRYPILLLNTRTYEQLRNSGSFRLISKLDISNHMMSYYGKIPYMRQIEDLYVEEFANYKKIAANVFEPAVLRRQEDNTAGVIRGTDNPELQKNALAFIKEWAVNAIYMNGSRKQIIANEEDLLKSANELLSYLEKNYHLKDE